MTLTWLDLYLVILVGKPKRLKVSTYLVFKLTGMPNVLPVLWDAKATLGIKIVPPPRLGSAGLNPPLIRQQLPNISNTLTATLILTRFQLIPANCSFILYTY